MRIGIDLDNTLISYDSIFFETALSKGLINQNFPKTKIAIRDYLRKINKDNTFTELQAEIYGPLVKNAEIFDGVVETLTQLSCNNKLYIVSHKTKYPYSGQKYNLRLFADEWLKKHGLHTDCKNSPITKIFYENNIEDKIQRISNLDCDLFIDDLPKILELLPKKTKGILFKSVNIHKINYPSFDNWYTGKLLIENLLKDNS